MTSRGKKLVALDEKLETEKGRANENVNPEQIPNNSALSDFIELCRSANYTSPLCISNKAVSQSSTYLHLIANLVVQDPSQGIFAGSLKPGHDHIHRESNSLQFTDVTNLTEVGRSADSTDDFCNLNDAVSQPSMSPQGVENISTTSREPYYAVIRTDAVEMNLTNITNPIKYEIIYSEDEDIFAEESSEYETSDSGKSNISSEDNTSIQSDNESNEELPSKKGKKRTRNTENLKKLKAKFLKNSGKSYQSRTCKRNG